MKLNSHYNWIEIIITKIFPVIFHWSPINNEWWKIPFEFFQWFTIEFPLITNGSTYLLNFPAALPFVPHFLPLVPIHYHSTFNEKLSQRRRWEQRRKHYAADNICLFLAHNVLWALCTCSAFLLRRFECNILQFTVLPVLQVLLRSDFVCRQICAHPLKYIMMSHFLDVSPLTMSGNLGVLYE